MVSSFFALIVILMGLSVFAFSDPRGFASAFVPFMEQGDQPSRIVYALGVLLVIALLATCFLAGGVTACMTLDLTYCVLLD